MTKKTDWLAAERFKLERSQFIIGAVSTEIKPYRSTVSATQQIKMERQAKKEAPPRHCIYCGKLLRKRVSVVTDRETDFVVFGYVVYGYRDCGYWCSRKCLLDHAPQITTRMMEFAEAQAGLAKVDLINAAITRGYYRSRARQIINLKRITVSGDV